MGANLECQECGSHRIKNIVRSLTRKEGKATLCGSCGEVRWKVIKVFEEDIGVGAKLQCACATCGKRPDLRSEEFLGKKYFIPTGESLYESQIITTHMYCARCGREDYHVDRLNTCFFKKKAKWHEVESKSLYFEGRRYSPGNTMIVCSKCVKFATSKRKDSQHPEFEKVKKHCKAIRSVGTSTNLIDTCKPGKKDPSQIN